MRARSCREPARDPSRTTATRAVVGRARCSAQCRRQRGPSLMASASRKAPTMAGTRRQACCAAARRAASRAVNAAFGAPSRGLCSRSQDTVNAVSQMPHAHGFSPGCVPLCGNTFAMRCGHYEFSHPVGFLISVKNRASNVKMRRTYAPVPWVPPPPPPDAVRANGCVLVLLARSTV